jgi:hypothetical protein
MLNNNDLSFNTLYEGLTNQKDSSKSSGSSSSTIDITGVGATSELYSQTVSTAISALETELSMDAYSDEYLNIIDNLKILYKQRALKTALQTPTKNDNTTSLFPLYLYSKNIETLEMLEDFINKGKNNW